MPSVTADENARYSHRSYALNEGWVNRCAAENQAVRSVVAGQSWRFSAVERGDADRLPLQLGFLGDAVQHLAEECVRAWMTGWIGEQHP